MASIQKKGKHWYIVWRVNGKQRWISTQQFHKKDALLILKEFQQNNTFDKFGLETEKKISFIQFIEEYYLPWSNGTKALKTYQSNALSAKHLKRFLGKVLLSKIDYSSIEDYKVWRKGSSVSNRTVNIDLICLGQIFKEAINRGFLKNNPMTGIRKLREEKKLPRFLSKDEIAILVDSASPYLKPTIILAVNTGLRHRELCNLRWGDIDWERKTIKVALSDRHKTKNLKEREMGLNNEAHKVLQFMKAFWINPSDMKPYQRTFQQLEYIICNRDGRPLKSLKQSLINAVRTSGLNNITWHTFRHTWASQAIMSGVNPTVVQQGLGHSNISTTMIYAHMSPGYFLDKVQKLDLGNNSHKLIEESKKFNLK